MKHNKFFIAGMAALALTFGLMFTGCPTTPPSDTVAVYSGGSGSTVTKITIINETRYIIEVDRVPVSEGTVVKNGDTYTFTSKTGKTFTATASGGAPQFNAPIPNDNGGSTSIPPLTVETNPGGDAGVPKFITITGITGLTGEWWVMLFDSVGGKMSPLAAGVGTIDAGSLTVALKTGANGDGPAWTGIGSYWLAIQQEQTVYAYTNGAAYPANINDLPKISITGATTSVAFEKFRQTQ
ncbi:hypothetical protein AGMMS50268_11700 [Spirochaetia bacterium]|nr:hypothetical protein AGMMS50268_11700 [Spirochaetia bacterium]